MTITKGHRFLRYDTDGRLVQKDLDENLTMDYVPHEMLYTLHSPFVWIDTVLNQVEACLSH